MPRLRVSCPLSINPKVSRELGTRHRAALGITEENDAIAIVVSEETGAISVALAGALERGLSPERLRDRLRVLLTRSADRRASGTGLSGLMAILRVRHVGLKVVSVVLAALLWLLVSGEQTVERALRVPLEFTNLPPQLELVGAPPAVVDVRVRGSSGTLGRVAAGELVGGARRSDRASRRSVVPPRL